MKDELFDFLRFMSETGITGIGSFYVLIAATWGLPFGDQINQTLMGISTLLGIFVEYQRSKHNKTTQFGTTTRPDEIAEDAKEYINGDRLHK